MFSYKKFTNIGDVEKDWLELQKNNEQLDAMAEFEFVKTFFSGITNKLKSLLKKGSRNVFVEVFKNDKPILIFPAVIGDEIVSAYTLDYYDVVSAKNLSKEDFLQALEFVANEEQKDIVLKKLKAGKNAHAKLDGLVEFENLANCVKISYTESYDDYYQSMSKNARQNLRTAYNRIATDGLKFEFEFFMGKTEKKLAKKLKNIYLNRRANKYKNMNFLKKLIYKIDEPISKVCFGLENSFSAVVKLDSKPVAFMAGVVKNGEAVVPRLAIDDRFARYSTGVILINETIKKFIEQKVFVLDLATGEEKYKFQMGGELHTNYQIAIKHQKNNKNS
ncbi:MAG: GNAT family N-acetyltransferase [Clostridia bacterium]|nr:GNAT family N-acetyltransferase [Clostridia bacterium]